MAVETSTRIFENVILTLERAGIDFPPRPTGMCEPGEWLVRGERHEAGLVGKETHFKPNAGKDASFGVFLGDNADPLQPGCFFVIHRSKVAPRYLDIHSKEMEEQVSMIAASRTPPLRLDTYGGYMTAASAVYRQIPTYNPRQGIVTTPHDIPVAEVELILVETEILNGIGEEIPCHLRRKIIPLCS